jgi:hypothetical protein
MDYKKLGIIAVLSAFVLFIITAPGQSSGLLRDALGGIGHTADNVALFFKGLVRSGP